MIYKDKDGKFYKVFEPGCVLRATQTIHAGDMLIVTKNGFGAGEFVTIYSMSGEQAILPIVEQKRTEICLEQTDLTEEEAKLINSL